MIYCGRLQSPSPALSAKNVLNVPQHASGPFPPAALASGFSLDLATNLVLLECLKLSSQAATCAGAKQYGGENGPSTEGDKHERPQECTPPPDNVLSPYHDDSVLSP